MRTLLLVCFPLLLVSIHSFQIDTLVPLELHVKTVKYFKSIERVQEEVERNQAALNGQVGSAD